MYSEGRTRESSQFAMEIGVLIVEEIEVGVRIGGVDEPDETSNDLVQGRNGRQASTKVAAGDHESLDSLHRLRRLDRLHRLRRLDRLRRHSQEIDSSQRKPK